MGDQGRLFGWLGQNRIARRQCRRNLAREDRQREVPRADADKGAAGRGCQRLTLIGVIAQEINGFAQLPHGVQQGFARLARQKGKDHAELCLIKIGGAAQDGAAFGRGGIPFGGGVQRSADIGGCGGQDMAHNRAGRGVSQVFAFAARDGPRQNGARVEQGFFMRAAGRLDPRQILRVGQIEPFRVAPGPEQGRPGGQRPVGFMRHRLHRIQRASGDGFRRNGLIHDLVDEAAVRAVFQQAAHQIGQKIAMRAHGGIYPAAGLVFGMNDVVQPLSHPVEPLEFKGRHVGGHVQNGRDRMRVMGRELRIDTVGHPQQLARIGDIADIGGLLAREHRERGQAHHLGALDLGIPIGALDQTHHDLAVQLFGQRVKPVNHRAGAPPVGLHHHAKPVPAFQSRVLQHCLDHLQGERQTVCLFGVDVEAKTRRLGQARQGPHARNQFLHHTLALGHFIARMQGREFHRNAGIVADILGFCRSGDRRDRLGVGQMIAARVMFGARGLTQHVIAVGIGFAFQIAGAFHCGLDGFAQNELAAHFLHRAGHGRADHRFPQTLDRAAQLVGDAGLAVIQHPPCQHQRPGRGIHKAGGRMPQMLAPIRGRDLVFDQIIHRARIRHPQKRLGKAHQGDAFFGGKTVFRKEHLHQAGLGGTADGAHQIGPAGRDAGAVLGGQSRLFQQAFDQQGFVAQGVLINDGPGGFGGVAGHGQALLFGVAYTGIKSRLS